MINTDLLTSGAAELGIRLSDSRTEQFSRLAQLLIEANSRFNLTAITDEHRIVTEHFLDSLSVFAAADPANKKILDVGTGAGFPGLPVAIACPEARCVLLDSTAKKLRYINEAAAALGLRNVSTVAARAEQAARLPEMREQFDIVYARAVSDMTILSEICLGFVKPGGIFAAQKAAGSEAEIKRAASAIRLMGGRVKEIKQVHIPGTELDRVLVVIEKQKSTPREYPREYGIIKKQAEKAAGKERSPKGCR